MWEIAGDYSRISNSDPGSILLGSQSESFMKPVTWDGRAFSGRYIFIIIHVLELTCVSMSHYFSVWYALFGIDSWLLNQFSAFQKVGLL